MTIGASGGDDRRLDEDLRAAAADLRRELTDHPTPDELVDYHLGTLSAEAGERIQEHLSLCPECSRVVLDMVEFSRGRPIPADSSVRSQGRLSWALAASLLAAVGLFGWNLTLRRDLSESRRPRTDLTLAELTPEAVQRRSAPAPVRVLVRAEQGELLLLLNLGELREFPRYRMELMDSGDEVVWAQSGVPRNQDGTFLLAIPAGMLEPGLYRIRLYGLGDDGSVLLAAYSFEVIGENLAAPGQ